MRPFSYNGSVGQGRKNCLKLVTHPALKVGSYELIEPLPVPLLEKERELEECRDRTVFCPYNCLGIPIPAPTSPENMKIKTIFIAGIIQGSKKGKVLHNQDYRKDLRRILNKYFPEAKIIDPVANHPGSAYYAHKFAKKVFHNSINEALSSDLVIAYLPQASMGTAVEMWECCKNKVPIWTISPLKENWAVKFLSKRLFSSTRELESYLKKCRGSL